MADMIERVARAIAEGLGDDFDHAFVSKSEWNAARGDKGGRFRDINEPRQADYLEAARAAIVAMREPTEAMVAAWTNAGPDLHYPFAGASDDEVNRVSATADWQAMIDAALSPEPHAGAEMGRRG